ncbi:MAG: hypothetical protein JWR44_1257 [Hymenobacter sp.]|nr:hypothetical protein [Hymenobacter sp.]
MKKFFALIGLLAIAGTGHAQSIAAGTVSLTGNVGYSRSSSTITSSYIGIGGGTVGTYTNEATNSQFGAFSSVGYFVASNLAIGVSLGYDSRKSAQKTTSTSTPSFPALTALPDLDPNTTVRAGAFVQYYKFFGEQFAVIGTMGGGYQHAKSYAYLYNNGGNLPIATTYKGNGYYAELTPGIIFFPIPRIGISASIGSLGFSHFNNDVPETAGFTPPNSYKNTSDNFSSGFGLDHLAFGGTYYFGR